MHAPQILMLSLLAIDVGWKLGMHGKCRAKYNGVYGLIDAGVFFAILCWGGFFRT
jgi:hypothetical protein